MTPTNRNLSISLSESLQAFAKDYITQHKNTYKTLPITFSDKDFSSPCEQEIIISTDDEDKVHWQPHVIDNELSFTDVESALEITFHPDIKAYFSTLYSDSMPATCSEGGLSLLFAWNSEDFKRLQENMIGHVLMKQKLKQKITLFFAVTDEEDMILSLMNDTGEVWVERVGCEPVKKVADSLCDFIQQIKPNPMALFEE
jgi:SecY interacting protein Syd